MAHIKSIVVGKGSYGSIGDISVRRFADSVIATRKPGRKVGPSTFRQVLHQVHFANVMRAYTLLNQTAPNGRGMCEAFPERPSGRTNVNMFVKYNFAKEEVFAVVQRKEESVGGVLVPAPFVVTRGTLPSVCPFFTVAQEGEGRPAYIVTPATGLAPGGQTTMGLFYRVLAEVLEGMGVEVAQGDRLTFFVMAYRTVGVPETRVYAPRFVVDFWSEEALPGCMQALYDGHVAMDLSALLGIRGMGVDVAPVLGRDTDEGCAVSDSDFSDNMLSSEAYVSHVGEDRAVEAAGTYGYKEEPFLIDN